MKRIRLLPVALAAVLSLAACNANRGATDETATVGTTGDTISAGEIYVRPFPDVNSGRWQVSTTGGVRPR